MFSRAKPAASGPMTVAVTQPAPCQQKLQITVATELVQPVRELVVKEFQKEAALAGFRKGKAPRELIERQFTEQIREETLRRMTRQIFEQVAEERKLKPVGPFEVIKLNFDEQKGLELEAQVEVEPDFKLGEYKGLKVIKTDVTVAAEDVEQALRQLQDSAAQLVPTGEGDKKEKKLPSLDEEFAKDVGFDTLDKLREHLQAKIREHKETQATQGLEQQVCEALLARHQFEVPPRLVSRQTERLTRDFQVRLLLSGAAEDKVGEELAKYTEQLRTNAVRHVKLSFLLERIAETEGLSVTQDELVDRLWTLARRWGKDPAEVRKLLDAQGLWPSVISSIRQDKAITFLLDAAQIEEPKERGA